MCQLSVLCIEIDVPRFPRILGRHFTRYVVDVFTDYVLYATQTLLDFWFTNVFRSNTGSASRFPFRNLVGMFSTHRFRLYLLLFSLYFHIVSKKIWVLNIQGFSYELRWGGILMPQIGVEHGSSPGDHNTCVPVFSEVKLVIPWWITEGGSGSNGFNKLSLKMTLRPLHVQGASTCTVACDHDRRVVSLSLLQN